MLIWLIIHLISAIIFVGYVFIDAIFKLNEDFKKIILKKFGFIYAISFISLFISGAMLIYLEHFSQTAFRFLMLKLSLVALMLLLTLFSIIKLRILKQKNGILIEQAHYIALGFCVAIVISAKLIQFN